MLKSGIDQQALMDLFASASAKQSTQLRQAVTEATLKALQGREMSLKNIRSVVKSVTQAASAGAAKNLTPQVDLPAMLESALSGLDDALLKAVDANRLALERFVDQGVDLQDKQLKKALGDLEQFEDTLLASVRKAVAGAGDQLATPWAEALGQFTSHGSAAGGQATATVAQLTEQARGAMRASRAAGLKAAQTLAQSYTALVSGVLMGMSDAMRQGASVSVAAPPSAEGASVEPAAARRSRATRKPAGA